MRHLLFHLERKEPSSGKMYSVPIFYGGNTPIEALLLFMHDHGVSEMAAFIEPILWVNNDYDTYSTELFLQGKRKRFTFKVNRQRRKNGKYLPGEKNRNEYSARGILATTIAENMKDVLNKILKESNNEN